MLRLVWLLWLVWYHPGLRLGGDWPALVGTVPPAEAAGTPPAKEPAPPQTMARGEGDWAEVTASSHNRTLPHDYGVRQDPKSC